MTTKKNKMEKDERIAWGVLRAFLSGIIVLFLLLGLVIKPNGAGSQIDMEFLWDALHPASLLNIIGVVLWILAIFGLTGLWTKMLPDYLVDKCSPWITHAIGVCAGLGILFIFAL